jgi:hypothetical protein
MLRRARGTDGTRGRSSLLHGEIEIVAPFRRLKLARRTFNGCGICQSQAVQDLVEIRGEPGIFGRRRRRRRRVAAPLGSVVDLDL